MTINQSSLHIAFTFFWNQCSTVLFLDFYFQSVIPEMRACAASWSFVILPGRVDLSNQSLDVAVVRCTFVVSGNHGFLAG